MLDAASDLLRGSTCLGCGRGGRLMCPDCLGWLAALPAARSGRQPVWPTPCPAGLVPPYAAGPYEGLARDLVIGHKERALLPLAGPLGLLLAHAVAAAVETFDGPVLLVPVPSRRAVVRARGHEPTWAIALAAARHLAAVGRPASAHRLLELRGPVRDQAGLGSRERSANLAGTMRCPAAALTRLRRRRPHGHVVVCDDVLTTGATAREAQRALEASGVRPAAIAVVAATVRRTTPSLASGGGTD